MAFLIAFLIQITSTAIRRFLFLALEFALICFIAFGCSMLSWKLSLRLDRKLLKKRLIGKHVIVVGGTSGLGLAISCEVVSAGASVSIIARGTKRSEADDPFENTKRKCLARKISDSQEVILFKADGSSYEQLVGALKLAYNDLGRPYWVINCAGVALPGYLRDQLPHIDLHHAPEAESQISSNYYTSLNLARAVTFLSSSAPELDSGHSDAFKDSSSPIYPSKIVFTGSVLSVMSFVGYSAYAASKYALKGLSDSLRSELLPYNVDVHICILGNIDTEAFVKEDRLKPSVTKLIEGKSTAQSPEYVASCVLAGLINNRYCITNEFLGEVFRMNGNNVAPRPNYISEIISMPIVAALCCECNRLINKEVVLSANRGKIDNEMLSDRHTTVR